MYGADVYRFEQLKVERAKANLEENPDMTSVMEKLHRFIYDDICEVEENILVTAFLYTRCVEKHHTVWFRAYHHFASRNGFSGHPHSVWRGHAPNPP